METVLSPAVEGRGQVPRGVQGGAVGLLEEERRHVLVAEVHDERALGDLGEPLLLEHVDDAGHGVLVGRLAAHLVEADPEEVVDLVELPERHVPEALPQLPGAGVAVLEPLEPRAPFLLESRILLHRVPEADVEIVERGDGEGLGGAPALVGGHEHAVGGPPVPEVVDADDPVAEGPVQVRQRLADDRGSDVMVGQVLGDVGRGVVDADGLPLAESGGEERLVAEGAGEEIARDRGAIQAEVDVRAGGLGGGQEPRGPERRHHVLGDLRGRRLLLPGRREAAHGEVAELRTRGGGHGEQRGVHAEDPAELLGGGPTERRERKRGHAPCLLSRGSTDVHRAAQWAQAQAVCDGPFFC